MIGDSDAGRDWRTVLLRVDHGYCIFLMDNRLCGDSFNNASLWFEDEAVR